MLFGVLDGFFVVAQAVVAVGEIVVISRPVAPAGDFRLEDFQIAGCLLTVQGAGITGMENAQLLVHKQVPVLFLQPHQALVDLSPVFYVRQAAEKPQLIGDGNQAVMVVPVDVQELLHDAHGAEPGVDPFQQGADFFASSSE